MPSLFKRSIAAIIKDGGERWKGKRIVSEAEWLENTNVGVAFQNGKGDLFNLEYALSHFPDPVGAQFTPMFVGMASQAVYNQVQQWHKDWAELIEHYRQIGRMPRHKPITPVV